MTDYREHIVKSFDDEISNVVHLVTQMATLVEEQYKLLYHVIDTGSPATTEDILENEPKLDNYDAEIRDAVITLITLRSPVVRSLTNNAVVSDCCPCVVTFPLPRAKKLLA